MLISFSEQVNKDFSLVPQDQFLAKTRHSCRNFIESNMMNKVNTSINFHQEDSSGKNVLVLKADDLNKHSQRTQQSDSKDTVVKKKDSDI